VFKRYRFSYSFSSQYSEYMSIRFDPGLKYLDKRLDHKKDYKLSTKTVTETSLPKRRFKINEM